MIVTGVELNIYLKSGPRNITTYDLKGSALLSSGKATESPPPRLAAQLPAAQPNASPNRVRYLRTRGTERSEVGRA